MIGDVKAVYPGIRLGIHCHNDQGLAVANSLQAVRSGADVVQVTMQFRLAFFSVIQTFLLVVHLWCVCPG